MTGEIQLSTTEKAVLLAVKEKTEAGEIAYPDKLAVQLGLPQPDVEKALDQLTFLGFVADGHGSVN